MSKDIREELKEYFRDYINNYISTEMWGLDNNLDAGTARLIIDLGREYHNEDAEEEKRQARQAS